MKQANHLLNTVYIGLGANLNNPKAQLVAALETISQLPKTQLICHSSFYISKPMGPQDQGDYINAVAKIESHFSAIALLDQLQQIELAQGRIRKDERWGPRTLDLDILLFNNEQINSSRLTIPHYGMKERNFVLLPLTEIAADLILPDGNKLAELVKKIDKQGILKL